MRIPLDEIFSKENQQMEQEILSDERIFPTARGEFEVLDRKPIHLQLTHTTKKHLQVDGSAKITLRLVCDRCLKDVPFPFSVQFHKEIDCANLESEDDSDDTQYIVDSFLDLDKILQDEVLLQWPAKVLCKEDCKGICTVCGQDLNVRDCGCDRVVLDPRMAAIQDIFQKENQE